MKSIFTFIGVAIVILVGTAILWANEASEASYWIFGIVLGIIIWVPSSKRKKE